MTKIITDNQARLLTYLQAQEKGVSKLTIMKALGIGDNTCDALLESLSYRVFITRERTGRSLAFSISINDAGRLALEHYNQPDAYQPVRVAPPTRNRMEGFYRPSAQAYYRNDGNKHISSLGAFA